ncbi:MAG: MmgE/PrpD family protein, partial [Candidatus Methanomethyliaceae archaeon]
PLTPGRAAMAGILSALLARKGFAGPLEIFEGTDGFLRAYSDRYDTSFLTESLGVRHETLNTYVKFYAACRHCHAPLDAILQLRDKIKFEPEALEFIEVHTYPAAIRLAGISEVNSPSAAKFSIPFSVSLALIRGKAGAHDYTHETVSDPRIRRLARKVKLVPSEKWATLYPKQRGASVRIVTEDGRDFFSEVALPRGEPENPASTADILKKFYENVRVVMEERHASSICELVLRLEELSNIEELMVLLRKGI